MKGERVRKLLWLVTVAAAAFVVGGGSTAMAGKPDAGTCAGGDITGTWDSLTITGTCRFSGPVTVNGNLRIADGAVLNDHGSGTPAPVHITGNVIVGNGAILGLGTYNPFALHDTTVDGNIVADQPLSLYLSFVTVHGSVISNGGGSGPAGPFRNFPTKDNTIDGNLIVQGWQGGWLGVIRNHVGGNVIVSGNASVVTDDGSPPPDTDSTEVMTNVIGGNLICQDNTPAAQVNPADGGQPNTVTGRKIGECAAPGI